MNNKWWLLLVAGLGLVLAVLLFPSMSTDTDIPAADPTNSDPTNFKEEPPPPRKGIQRAGSENMGRRATIEESNRGPRPDQKALLERRSEPDALAAAKIIGPISAVRRELILTRDDTARELADAFVPMMTEIAKLRRNPDEVDFDSLETPLRAAMADVMQSEWASNPVVITANERFEMLYDEYEETKAE